MRARPPLATPLAALGRSPALAAAAAMLPVLVVFAGTNGGFGATTWYPAALVLLAVLPIALLVAPALGHMPRPVALAMGLLWLYTAWSYLSITWAGQKGDAWDGANRTVLYAIAFSLFAVWPMRARAAATVLGAFSLAIAAVGLIELLKANSSSHVLTYFLDARFSEPIGYPNANVCMWFAAFFPCVTLGSRRELHPLLRGLFLASASLLGGLALMGQTRGWLYAAPVVIVIYLLASPDRVRTTVALLAVLAAATVYRVPVERVHDAFARLPSVDGALAHATSTLLWTSLVLGLITVAVAYLDRRLRIPRRLARRANRGLLTAVVLVLVVGGVVLAASAGHPSSRLQSAWNDFKRGPQPTGSEARFNFALGSNRYDFWRVAWLEARDHPIGGVGADNFQEQYFLHRHSDESPLYPHSIEFRALASTGFVGTALLFGAIVFALVAAWGAIRGRSGLGAATAAGAATWFLYWLAHGSVDWFWEFPVLGLGAFATLGLAASLLPRPAGSRAAARPLVTSTGALAVAVVAAGIVALGMLSPWLSHRAVNEAAQKWPADLAGAFDELDTAASLNPLSPQPQLVRASIAQRVGLNDAAMRNFQSALDRDPRNTYAVLELGAMAAEAGRRAEAERWLARLRLIDPRDDLGPLIRNGLRSGKPMPVSELNALLLDRARKTLR